MASIARPGMFLGPTGMSFAPADGIELVARVPHLRDGWSKSCRLSGRNPHGARRDKIPGDLSGQELASLGSMPIPKFLNQVFETRVELAMRVSDIRISAPVAEAPTIRAGSD